MKGHIAIKDNIKYVVFYTCNKRCCEITEHNKLCVESVKCCETVYFPIKLEQQDLVTITDQVEFILAEDVDIIINNDIGIYVDIIKVI